MSNIDHIIARAAELGEIERIRGANAVIAASHPLLDRIIVEPIGMPEAGHSMPARELRLQYIFGNAAGYHRRDYAIKIRRARTLRNLGYDRGARKVLAQAAEARARWLSA